MRKPQGLTKPQIAAYSRAACAAARALGEPLDAYRKRVYAVGSGRRLAVLIGAVCEQVMQLKCLETAETGAPATTTPAEDYLRTILNRSGNLRSNQAGGWWLDLTDTNLQAVFAMLDTHRRRLIRRLNHLTSSAVPLAFSMEIGYVLMGTHLATYELPSHTVRVNIQ